MFKLHRINNIKIRLDFKLPLQFLAAVYVDSRYRILLTKEEQNLAKAELIKIGAVSKKFRVPTP